MTTYKGIDVYKLTCWVQGPVMLQALNMLETLDLKAMGYNSAAYIHTLYQVMNLAFADRDFYYGDPYFPPEEPLAACCPRTTPASGVKLIDRQAQRSRRQARRSLSLRGQKAIPISRYLDRWPPAGRRPRSADPAQASSPGTTSIQAADEEGWVVSVTPSGGWVPAVIAGPDGHGHEPAGSRASSSTRRRTPSTSSRPGKRPRATLTPGLALKDGKPYLSFAVQGGDTQDQNLLQFFLDVVEFGMNVQQACEAPNINSYQMRELLRRPQVPPRQDRHQRDRSRPRSGEKLRAMGYTLDRQEIHVGPDQRHLLRPASRHVLGRLAATTARTTASPGRPPVRPGFDLGRGLCYE